MSSAAGGPPLRAAGKGDDVVGPAARLPSGLLLADAGFTSIACSGSGLGLGLGSEIGAGAGSELGLELGLGLGLGLGFVQHEHCLAHLAPPGLKLGSRLG